MSTFKRQTRDRILKDPVRDYINCIRCDSCGLDHPKQTAIESRYFEDVFYFCSDECFSYYLGEVLPS